MCHYECKGDYHRPCTHFVVRYYTGARTDCHSEHCKTSSAHIHKTARNCGCPEVKKNDEKMVNLLQYKCDACLDRDRAQGLAAYR